MKFVKPAALAVALAYGGADDECPAFQHAYSGSCQPDRAGDCRAVLEAAVVNSPYDATLLASPKNTAPPALLRAGLKTA
jgi:hypothetical protein